MEAFAEYLSWFFRWMLRSSGQACVLILLILAVQLLLRRKLSPRWHYCLWMLLLVRLAVPWSPASPTSIYNILPSCLSFQSFAMDDQSISDQTRLLKLDGSIIKTSGPLDTSPVNNQEIPAGPAHELRPAVTEIVYPIAVANPEITSAALKNISTQDHVRPDQPHRFDMAGWVMGKIPLIWLVGALGLLLYVSVSNFLFWRRISRQIPLSNPGVLDLLERCKEQMRVHTHLPVVVSKQVQSPALFGFVRPRLLLPHGAIENLSREQLRYIFLHELAHLKRYDILTGWLMMLLQVMHWFNPLIWWAFHRIRSDRELACDNLVLSYMQVTESKQYGRTIVYLLEHFFRLQRLPSIAGILENKTLLKRRIIMITQTQKNSKLQIFLAVGILALLAGMTLTDARAQNSDQNTKKTAPTVKSPQAAAEQAAPVKTRQSTIPPATVQKPTRPAAADDKNPPSIL
ncbi:MAG: hypothetical protein AMJ79_14235, partial [Phycisphaerae bacterium SM23_30]